MKLLNAGINFTRTVTKGIAMIMLFLMMLIITISVIMRGFSNPFSGQVELVELSMLVLIMVGLSYTQSQEGHVDVGLIVDRFSIRVQAVFDIIASILIIIVSIIISIYNFEGFLNYIDVGYKSRVLSIPLYPFKLIISVGMFLWGLEALLKLIKSVLLLLKGDNSIKKNL